MNRFHPCFDHFHVVLGAPPHFWKRNPYWMSNWAKTGKKKYKDSHEFDPVNRIRSRFHQFQLVLDVVLAF